MSVGMSPVKAILKPETLEECERKGERGFVVNLRVVSPSGERVCRVSERGFRDAVSELEEVLGRRVRFDGSGPPRGSWSFMVSHGLLDAMFASLGVDLGLAPYLGMGVIRVDAR